MWLVVLTKQPTPPYPAGFFPRKFFNKKDAMFTIDFVRREGGEAMLTYDETLKRERV